MKYSINAASLPDQSLPYSLGTTAGRLIFSSGLIAQSDSAVELEALSVADQFKSIIYQLETLLAECDCSLPDVAKVTIYLTQLETWSEIEESFKLAFGSPEPALSLVEVKKLPSAAKIEMDAIACR